MKNLSERESLQTFVSKENRKNRRFSMEDEQNSNNVPESRANVIPVTSATSAVLQNVF